MGKQEHRERLRRYLALIHGVVLLGFALVVWSTGLSAAAGDLSRPHALLGSGLVGLAALTARRGERPDHLVPALLLTGGAATAPFTGAGDVSGPLVLTATFLCAVRTLRSVPAVLVVASATLLFLGVREATGSPVDLNLVGSLLLGVANTFVAGAFVQSLERSTEAMDRAEGEAREGNLRLAAQRARESAVSSTRQVLHDEVLSALHAIADPMSTESGSGEVSRANAVRMSQSAVAAVEDFELSLETPSLPRPATSSAAAAGVESWIDGLRADSPLPFSVELDLAGAEWGLTSAQERAATRAALEALRNARRHAGASRAALTINREKEMLRVSVMDAGPGIPPGTPEGVGLTESVRGSVGAVGGEADVVSGPHGTRIDLRFPPSSLRPAGRLARTYDLTIRAGAQQRLLTATMLPLGVVWILIGLSAALGSDTRTQQLALLVAATAANTAITLRLRRGALTGLSLSVIAVGLLALQALGLLLLPDGGLLDLRSWSVGFLASPLLVLCFVLPVRWGVALVGAHVLLILMAVRLDPALADGLFPVSAVNAVVGIPAITVLLGLGLRRNSVVIEQGRAATLGAAAELIHRRYASDVSSLHLDHTRRAVVPWLREVAEGRVDVTEDRIRQRARLLMLETRDDLHAPGFHSADQRAATTAFRADGGVVDIRPGFAPGAHDRLSGRLLHHLAARLSSHHRVTVSPPGEGRSTARLVVLPPPPEDVVGELTSDSRFTVRGDELALEVEFEDR
jgi:hypothetical protein